jgi:large repetitive protein
MTQYRLASRPDHGAGSRRRLRLLVAVTATAVGLGAAVGIAANPASASTLNGAATVASPTTQAPLASGGSTTPFTLTLPANAACTGDTASNGYHVYSYLVKSGVSPSSATFISTPSVGYGLVDNTGAYYGPINTAIGTGQIVGIANNFQWAPLVATDGVPLSTLLYTKGKSGVWETGLVCANASGHVTDNWNAQVTFTASAGDPHGFVWAALIPLHVVTTSVPAATRGAAYSFQIVATGGVTPYKWAKTGTLPKGLKLGKTGVLAGTPSVKAAAGDYTFGVTIKSGKKTTLQTVTQSFTLHVN